MKYKDKEWLVAELKTKQIKEIGEQENVSSHTISRWIKKHNIKLEDIKKATFPYREKDWLIEKLKEHNGSITSISKETGFDRSTINDWCLKYGMDTSARKRKYKLNEDYFSKIDSERKAYWLGLLMADGFMNKDLYNFGIGLHPKDEQIIKEFILDVNYGGEIYDSYSGFLNYEEDIVPYKYIKICSKKMCSDLVYHGIVPRKSGKESFPDTIPDEFKKDFIRGFFDGDGTINKRSCKIEFYSSSYNILLSIKEYVEQILNIKEYEIKRKKDHDNPYFSYSVFGKNTIELGNHMYENSSIFLKRKNDILLDIYKSRSVETQRQ